jgi:hypothetical protein
MCDETASARGGVRCRSHARRHRIVTPTSDDTVWLVCSVVRLYATCQWATCAGPGNRTRAYDPVAAVGALRAAVTHRLVTGSCAGAMILFVDTFELESALGAVPATPASRGARPARSGCVEGSVVWCCSRVASNTSSQVKSRRSSSRGQVTSHVNGAAHAGVAYTVSGNLRFWPVIAAACWVNLKPRDSTLRIAIGTTNRLRRTGVRTRHTSVIRSQLLLPVRGKTLRTASVARYLNRRPHGGR